MTSTTLFAALLICLCVVSTSMSATLLFNTTSKDHRFQPKVFLLVLGTDAIHNENIWQLFLKDDVHTRFSFFVHIKEKIFKPFEGFKYHQVKTVDSTYCSNIVPPMIQLLSEALNKSHNSQDKFLFLSDRKSVV